MRALQISGVNQLALTTVADPTPKAGEALVSIRSAALNHRDLWIKLGQYAGIKYPCIPGSDGAGVVKAVGPGVDSDWVGKDVVIYPGAGWGDSEAAQGSGFSILGLPADGTLADLVCVPVGQLAAKPKHLSWDQAAALPLAGVTGYRALVTRAQVKAGEKVLITGIGGGVAIFALQFAVALGAKVWVSSSSPEKIARAVKLGAQGGFQYNQPEWAKAAAKEIGGFDVIIDSAGGDGFSDLIDLCNPGARIAFFGATRGNPSLLPMRKVFWRQVSLLGSTLGSPRDWVEMVNFVVKHGIVPVVSDVVPVERAADAFDHMENAGQFGKLVVHFGGE
jgi:zinc-binding alcohol dehydrogenase/oxidoreductase